MSCDINSGWLTGPHPKKNEDYSSSFICHVRREDFQLRGMKLDYKYPSVILYKDDSV